MLQWNRYDINSALNRTLYVDSVNGDDNNIGTESKPLKSFNKAITSIPSGGSVNIVLLNNYIHADIVEIFNKRVVIYLNGYEFHVSERDTGFCGNFVCDHSTILFLGHQDLSTKGKIVFDEPSLTTSTNVHNTYGALITGWIGLFSSVKVEFGYYVEIVDNADSIFYLLSVDYKTSLLHAKDLSFVGARTSLKDYIVGIQYDTNGVPRNILSNIIF